ncbi:hypothetical protein LWC08_06830 [Desulfobaculum bizertense]|uniref:FtsX-like permease family protein n=1 Tax=Desulfobaculum bizertense TaxID=376490 RepID=UPI001F3B21E8|nr:FtsX-like permease family protein [Desulfobaculum bizertense]UIJ39276.1 hypothetical protein LWC08_06830 [Desulfobaculum bizertense]
MKSILSLALALALFLAVPFAKAAPPSADAQPSIMEQLSAIPDRSVGSPGHFRAAELVSNALSKTLSDERNVICFTQHFSIPVQQVEHCSITRADGRTEQLFPLRMNALSPSSIPAPGLNAPVLAVGKGELRDFNGHDVSGRIILMDLDSGKNWQNAAMLGARAVIFTDPRPGRPKAPRNELEKLFEPTPIDFPRFWMPYEQASRIFGAISPKSSFPPVTLRSSMHWTRAPTQNIACLIPGSDETLKNELCIFEAFYDSTADIPGNAPGADEACSIDTLLALAHEFERTPPKRSVLLLATAGHAQGQAGMREFTYALSEKIERLENEAGALALRKEHAQISLELLEEFRPEEDKGWPRIESEQKLLREALGFVVKTQTDALSAELARLRLSPDFPERSERIAALAKERLNLRRLSWLPETAQLSTQDKKILTSLIAPAQEEQQRELADATLEEKELGSTLLLREQLDTFQIKALVSLHLSSHGTGIGAFERGWLYLLRPTISRTRFLSPLAALLRETAAKHVDGKHYTDMLRPSLLDSWQGFLPDKPQLGSEPFALSGRPGITLASTHDARSSWGTPYDELSAVDMETHQRQNAFVLSLAQALVSEPIPDSGTTLKNGFASLRGRANLLRQGEVFPDRPAEGTSLICFQAYSRFPAMVDHAGNFAVHGLADKKHSVHKAILEGFLFDTDTGRAVWAIDKPATGKSSYRVKMNRLNMETNLIMFRCAQSTFFEMLDARTFHYVYRPTLIDSRTESTPLRFWYSRLDTRSSTLGTFFLPPEVPLKLTLSDTVLDKKVILLNASAETPTGKGYRLKDWPVVTLTPYRAATDMWSLLTPRITNLEQRGIIGDRLREMAAQGQAALSAATQASQEKQWDSFLDSSRTALSIASQVYNDVDSIQKDVLLGVLFYIALFVPFAYCMERLVFGFTDITKRIAGFLFFLVAIIAIISLVHPAFQLTYSPMVVILAFFIVGLSVLVSLIIFFRFEREMKELQQRSGNVKTSGLSHSSAFAAAFILGVSNLRRRPLRTLLTCTTLTLLTFTIMNFTAVRSQTRQGWSAFRDAASYSGVLLKNIGWKDLPVEALGAMNDFSQQKYRIAPRVWYEILDRTRAPSIPVQKDISTTARARGIVGLSAIEPQISGLDKELSCGRWFRPDEQFAVILPDAMAQALGVDLSRPESTSVRIWGMPFTVVGCIKKGGLESHPDLDGEAMTPIIYPSEAATVLSDVEAEALEEGRDIARYSSRYQHIPGEETLLVPYTTLLGLGGSGGKLKALAIAGDSQETEQLATELSQRFGLMIFRGTLSPTPSTSLFYAATATKYSGIQGVAIPILICVCIVLNTMIGSVYERKNEIAIYTSVGLAPSHVSFLFIAEALALGIISIVAGYLLAQASSALLSGTAIWSGMTANYSSLAAIAAMSLVLLVVLVSTIYPSRVAANVAIPDVSRSWNMPTPEGDTLNIVLPFLINLNEQTSAGGFLQQYYAAHADVSHGLFCTDEMFCELLQPGSLPPWEGQDLHSTQSCLMIQLQVWLAPFDFGVRQNVRITFCPSDVYKGFMQIRLFLERESGEKQAWINANKGFINDLRKQLLIWRSLDDAGAENYSHKLRLSTAEELAHRDGFRIRITGREQAHDE